MIQDISVVVPVKDEKELPYLSNLLEQICYQNMKYRLEIIIVCNCEARKIAPSLHKLKEKFEHVPRIQIGEYESTQIEALNIGAEMAQGNILVFLDVDNLFVQNPWNGDNTVIISDMITPILKEEYVMTYIPPRYNESEGKTDKDKRLIKYQNFLLRFNLFPKPPFAISKAVFKELGLKGKNPYQDLVLKLLWKYPGGIKKVEDEVLVSPRHILERARKKT